MQKTYVSSWTAADTKGVQSSALEGEAARVN